MTLADAFFFVTGSDSTASADAPAIEAAQILIYRELQALARRFTRSSELGEESASRSFQRLVLGGPRSVARDDRVVRSYLWRMLDNGLKDLRRKQQREAAAPGDDDVADFETPEKELLTREDEDRRAQLAAWAMAFVFETLAEQLASRRGSRSQEGFRESVRQLEQLVRGAVTFENIVVRECGALTDQTRARIYQQHCRVRRSFLTWVDDELSGCAFTDAQSGAIKRVIGLLRR
jgi:DNA-directed RNA polymerase specialized sigma24 family protein